MPTPVGAGPVVAAGRAAHAPAAPHLTASTAQTQAKLEQNLAGYLRARLAEAISLGDAEAVPPDGALDALGLSSLMVIELRNRVERDFAVNVPPQTLPEGGAPLAPARAITASTPAVDDAAANNTATSTRAS